MALAHPLCASETAIADRRLRPTQNVDPPSSADSLAPWSGGRTGEVRGEHHPCFQDALIAPSEAVRTTTDLSITSAPDRVDPNRVRMAGRIPWFVTTGEEPLSHEDRVSCAELDRAVGPADRPPPPT
ncbi:hypothetical protein [Streptomyces akebiae]|uniref:Uncharacterized protein n=1 Tax=Streptomyces akebiae TaxID=2865673 RepID=A0ABX8XJV6_9ACTN|nr:hypothetical protein [Streptomyces akebiae]QYX75888.1 hypothetical protein K1J60_04600 [Streptomyces akebiae]